jgi:hypothetical protein
LIYLKKESSGSANCSSSYKGLRGFVSETIDLKTSLSKVLKDLTVFSEAAKLLKLLPCSVSKKGS